MALRGGRGSSKGHRVSFEVIWDTEPSGAVEARSPWSSGKWEEMEADLTRFAELEHEQGESFVGLQIPVSSPSAACSTSGFESWKAPASLALGSLPPSVGFDKNEGSGWLAHGEDATWLYKPAERTYFHLPSETLWRLDATGLPVRLEDLRARAVAALAAPQEPQLLRLMLAAWHRHAACRSEVFTRWSESLIDEETGRDLVADAIAATLEALQDFNTGDAQSAFRAVQLLRRLHAAVAGDWRRRLATDGTATAAAALASPTVLVAGSAAVDAAGVPAAYFHARLRGLLALGDTMTHCDLTGDRRFWRLRGALSFAWEAWSEALRQDGAEALQVAVDETFRTRFALDAVTVAAHGSLDLSDEDLLQEHYAAAKDLPSALRVALRQLGPIERLSA